MERLNCSSNSGNIGVGVTTIRRTEYDVGEREEEGEEAKEEQEGEEHSPYTSPHLPIARSCGKYW